MTLLAQQFHQAMFDVYVRAKRDFGYNASRFLQMLDEHGGEQTAHILLQAPGVSDGYTALWELGGLELTVEAVVLDPKWHSMFSDGELRRARKRLADYGCDVVALEQRFAKKGQAEP